MNRITTRAPPHNAGHTKRRMSTYVIEILRRDVDRNDMHSSPLWLDRFTCSERFDSAFEFGKNMHMCGHRYRDRELEFSKTRIRARVRSRSIDLSIDDKLNQN